MSGSDGVGRHAVPRARRPTMDDIACEAGVALPTVSRVVKGDATVGEAFSSRVQQAIATRGCQPDERARQLRSGVTEDDEDWDREAGPDGCRLVRSGDWPDRDRPGQVSARPASATHPDRNRRVYAHSARIW